MTSNLLETYVGDNLPAVNLGTNVLVLRISLGSDFTCALTNLYQIKCFGQNENYGQLGQGSTVSQIPSTSGQMGDSLPYVQIGTGYSVIGVAAGDSFVCVLLNNQKVKCWDSMVLVNLEYALLITLEMVLLKWETTCDLWMNVLQHQPQHICQPCLLNQL
jgi:hypothetical protein